MTRIAENFFRLILIALLLLFAIKGIILGSWGLAIIELVLAGFLAFAFWWDHREKSKKRRARHQVFIFTGSRENIKDTAVPLLRYFPEHRLLGYNAMSLEDPSEMVGDLFGTDPQVWEALCELNPGLEEKLRQRVDGWLSGPGFSYGGRVACVFVHCEAGWHRSVAVGEKLAEIFKEKGHPAITTHLGADNDR
ncbi:hypothetical protein [Corynebacterium ulcerans]|uniref:hypothetical protein n=1 Tax=Corynebacterium ulcerans TaxID=65058 RepID=UPI000C76E239|nr:hypothetical protein [Corynebacterium ulcerans]PLW02098.1 hypothetical protein BRL54_08965 [Corynebacterium ulcerans]